MVGAEFFAGFLFSIHKLNFAFIVYYLFDYKTTSLTSPMKGPCASVKFLSLGPVEFLFHDSHSVQSFCPTSHSYPSCQEKKEMVIFPSLMNSLAQWLLIITGVLILNCLLCGDFLIDRSSDALSEKAY